MRFCLVLQKDIIYHCFLITLFILVKYIVHEADFSNLMHTINRYNRYSDHHFYGATTNLELDDILGLNHQEKLRRHAELPKADY